MQSKSRWEQFKEKYGDNVTPLDFFNPHVPRANEDLSNFRMDICVQCDRLITLTKQCRECGCFMNMKTKLLGAKCPLGKW